MEQGRGIPKAVPHGQITCDSKASESHANMPSNKGDLNLTLLNWYTDTVPAEETAAEIVP
jgi:hypothetical protein